MNPVLLVLLLFIGIPVIELYFLIQVGSEFGAIPTIVLSVFTAVLGGLLVRVQGISTLMRVQATLARDEAPTIEVLEGVVLLIAGFFLLLPGFFTDIIGFLFLVPLLRRTLVLLFLRRSGVMRQQSSASADESPHPNPRIIEGEYRREDD